MGRKRERTQRHSNVYSSSYCNRFPHNEIVIIHKARCKRIYKVPVLKAQGGGNRKTQAPTVVLQRLVQACARSRCKLVYKVTVLRSRGANPNTLGAEGAFTKACSGV